MLTLDGTNKIVADNLSTEVTTLLTPKNWIINGGFDVWQRGTSQTTAGYGSDDRWSNYNDVSTKTHTREPFTVGQTTVPNNPKYFSRTVVSSGGTSLSYVTKTQSIEDVTKLAGKTVAVSFWAKADGNRSIVFELRQRFGTGGSASVSGIGLQKLNLTTSWQRFTKIITLPSVSGKTVGADSSTQLQFWFDAGSGYTAITDSLGNQSGTFDIANVSLVEGSVPVEWQTEAYADVLNKCDDYCQKILLPSGKGFFVASNYNGSSAYGIIPLRKEMRSIPTSVSVGVSNGWSQYGNNGSGLIAGKTLTPFINATYRNAIAFEVNATGATSYFIASADNSNYVMAEAEL